MLVVRCWRQREKMKSSKKKIVVILRLAVDTAAFFRIQIPVVKRYCNPNNEIYPTGRCVRAPLPHNFGSRESFWSSRCQQPQHGILFRLATAAGIVEQGK
jgi:hypothetical protein